MRPSLTLALAAAFAIGAVAAPVVLRLAPAPTYELAGYTPRGDRSVLDYSLTGQDCADAVQQWRPMWPGHLRCEREAR